jgi:hypothetical protein
MEGVQPGKPGGLSLLLPLGRVLPGERIKGMMLGYAARSEAAKNSSATAAAAAAVSASAAPSTPAAPTTAASSPAPALALAPPPPPLSRRPHPLPPSPADFLTLLATLPMETRLPGQGVHPR